MQQLNPIFTNWKKAALLFHKSVNIARFWLHNMANRVSAQPLMPACMRGASRKTGLRLDSEFSNGTWTIILCCHQCKQTLRSNTHKAPCLLQWCDAVARHGSVCMQTWCVSPLLTPGCCFGATDAALFLAPFPARPWPLFSRKGANYFLYYLLSQKFHEGWGEVCAYACMQMHANKSTRIHSHKCTYPQMDACTHGNVIPLYIHVKLNLTLVLWK